MSSIIGLDTSRTIPANTVLITPPRLQKKTPTTGWAPELERAIRAAKHEPSVVARHVKVTIAATMLRQWKQVQSSAEAGLVLLLSNDASSVKLGTKNSTAQQLQKFLLGSQKHAMAELLGTTHDKHSPFSDPTYDVAADIRKQSHGAVNCIPENGTFHLKNANPLQMMASAGFARTAETLISIGAAVDYPVAPADGNNNQDYHPSQIAPVGLTPLNLALHYANIYQKALYDLCIQRAAGVDGLSKETCLERLSAYLQCAIILVMHGANIALRGTEGLTAKEQAIQLNNRELVEAMTKMEEDPENHAWCRCGSRLPWKECHASQAQAGQHSHFLRDKNGSLHFSLSPLAGCFCGTTHLYYECCWFCHKAAYLVDATGKVLGPPVTFKTNASSDDVRRMYANMDEWYRRCEAGQATPSLEFAFPGTREQQKKLIPMAFRMYTPEQWQQCWSRAELRGKSRLGEWSQKVYASVMERTESGLFGWCDVNWKLGGPLVEQRAALWNKALDQYCDEKGLMGTTRDSVVAKHKAVPLDPCGHPGCNARETSVKEFKRCSNCKRIAYCSVECQRLDWRAHKPMCQG